MSLVNLKKEAKRWLKDLRAGDAEARARLRRVYPDAPPRPVLRDVQHALAREHGHENWVALKAALETPAADVVVSPPPMRSAAEYERIANDMVLAFDANDEAALQRVNAHYQRSFTFDDLWAEIWRRVYAFRQRAFRGAANFLQPTEAQLVIAQDAGFDSWSALMRATETGESPIPPHDIDMAEGRIAPRRLLSEPEWDELIAIMKAHRLTRLDANGMMTDAVLQCVATLDHVTALSLGGSRELTDEGLRHLARMPQLETLDTTRASPRSPIAASSCLAASRRWRPLICASAST